MKGSACLLLAGQRQGDILADGVDVGDAGVQVLFVAREDRHVIDLALQGDDADRHHHIQAVIFHAIAIFELHRGTLGRRVAHPHALVAFHLAHQAQHIFGSRRESAQMRCADPPGW